MAQMVKQKIAYYKGKLMIDVTEDKVYREIEQIAGKCRAHPLRHPGAQQQPGG